MRHRPFAKVALSILKGIEMNTKPSAVKASIEQMSKASLLDNRTISDDGKLIRAVLTTDVDPSQPSVIQSQGIDGVIIIYGYEHPGRLHHVQCFTMEEVEDAIARIKQWRKDMESSDHAE